MSDREIYVSYLQGGSAYSNKFVDYMIADLSWDDVPDDHDEEGLLYIDGKYKLYAEMENPTYNEETGELDDECATFDDLQKVIVQTAKRLGIDVKRLNFQGEPYDGE